MNKKMIPVCLITAVLLALAAPAPATKTPNPLKPKRVRSYSTLVNLLKKHQPRYFSSFRTGLAALADAAAPAAAPGGGSSSVSYSSTTVQVAGVDEGDEVKNDGNYIYQLNQGRVLVIHAYPDTEIGVVSSLDFTDGSFYPQELYLDGAQLVVVGTAFHEPAQPTTVGPWGKLIPIDQPIWYYSTSTIQARVYDISDPANPNQTRTVEIDGDYVSTRKVGSNLYLISRQYPNFYAVQDTGASGINAIVPTFRDSARGKQFRSLSSQNCYYFPGFDDPNYLVIAGVDLGHPKSLLHVNAYLGAGEQVYASLQNLYVTASRSYDVYFMEPLMLANTPAVTGAPITAKAAGLASAAIAIDPLPRFMAPRNESTDIYKFTLNNGNPVFVAANTVGGSIQNSYSMDDNGTHFRVATTAHNWWDSSNANSNSVFVLDANMDFTGSLEGIAPGEEIYAARFVGNRLFLVTFHQVDPLFAIDLSDPANPSIVGQLTLPGYSNFLLPYDENHLIGIGKDAVVAPAGQTGGDVPWWDGQAFYQGLKIALFDVTDLKNPVVMASVTIGDRGTDSPALWDPHAILFDKSQNLLALPVNVARVANPDPANPWQWGDTVFQGLYVYKVSPDAGIALQGTVTHIPDSADIWSNWDRQIDRALFIGSDLYTLSQGELKVNDLNTLVEKSSLELPQPPPPVWETSGGFFPPVVVTPLVKATPTP